MELWKFGITHDDSDIMGNNNIAFVFGESVDTYVKTCKIGDVKINDYIILAKSRADGIKKIGIVKTEPRCLKVSNENKELFRLNRIYNRGIHPNVEQLFQNLEAYYDVIYVVVDWINLSQHELDKLEINFRDTYGFTRVKDWGNFKLILKNHNKMSKFKELLESCYQIVLQGPPGTGKTRLAKEIAYSIIKNDVLASDGEERDRQLKELSESEQFKIIQFHPAYSYEDFVRGIVAKATDKGINYVVENKILAQMASNACKSDKPYVLIIDEINRANLPAVLGELIYGLEYRGEPVESMYALPPDDNRTIILPKNFFIIGTMNTADRSVGNMDYALRRRFVFQHISPDSSVITNDEALKKFKEIQNLINNNISPEFEIDDIMIGHSYFLGDYKSKLEHQVKPLLIEYLKDGVLAGDNKEEIKKKIKDL